MYQRLLFVLAVLCISGMSMAQNVMTPADGDYIYNSAAALGSNTNPIAATAGVMQKWVHDPNQNGKSGRIPWDQTNYKSYRFNTISFRVRFPVGYDPLKKYPCMVFLHGAGEAAYNNDPHNTSDINRENQDHLFWGAQLFEQRMVAGEWNGFLLFPQLLVNPDGSGSQWDNNTFPIVNGILDTMQKYNGLDPDRIITMGLSAGAKGGVDYAKTYATRIASVVVANPRIIEALYYPSQIDSILQIPIYMTAGGQDNFPGPAQVMQYRDSLASKGGNIYLGYNPTLGHSSWTAQWNETDIHDKFLISTYWNSAHKAQPLLYYQKGQFCTGSPISAKMGISKGYAAYEWQLDAGGGFTTIPGATTNIYTATQAGSYRVHFKRDVLGAWSDWTPAPILISTKSCSADTAFVEHFDSIPIIDYVPLSGGPVFQKSSYFKYNFTCQNGIFTNSTEVFTQDGAGHLGGGFMLNNTSVSSTNCPYFAGDQVWRSPNNPTVLPNTNYTLNFSMANNSQTLNAAANNPPAALVPKINGVALTATGVQTQMVGDISWKKYSYVWNSGSATSAEIAITNNTINGTGNDFALDEISLVKYSAPAMPAGVNPTLWSKAASIAGVDGNAVRLWNNNDVNGNNLLQNTIGKEPTLKNNGTDNINFNPVVSYSTATGNNLYASKGFSGVTLHNAAHMYIVAKTTATTSGLILAQENQASSLSVGFTTGASSTFTFSAGSNLNTPNGANETGKPIIWTLSKDNLNNTGNGNKQDIRKNGLLIASSASNTSFTGTGSDFRTGNFNGSIAEIIYLLDTTLNAATENMLESYLALKYGTTLGYRANSITYKASDGSTFWPASAVYQTDVFGIGTDSVSGLIQTISNSANSGSGDGTGQSAKGNLVLSTNTPLLDKHFLMIGNDSASLTQSVIPSGGALSIAVGSTRINREWKVVNTGNVGAVNLSFDTTGLGLQAGGSIVSNYALMIDNDGDGNFANNTISFFNATSATGKKINFAGATLSNGVVFTIITLKSSALPATWLGFTADAVNGNALLNWKTADEINVDKYVVEHSYNGISFTAIGTVSANNNSGVNNYSYTDNGLAAGTHYYRIRRIDLDGKSDYSDTKTVKIIAAGANVQVRPNPVTGSTLVLAVTVQQNTKTSVQVLSADGKLMLRQSISLVSGSNLVNLNVSEVPTGIYLLQVQLNDEVITKKFIRSH